MLAGSRYGIKALVPFCATHRGHLATVASGFAPARTMKESIYTPEAPAPIGPYNQAVKANGLVFVSGQIGLDPRTMQLVEGGVKAQAKQCLANISNILKAARCSPQDIVSTTVLVTDTAHFGLVNQVYGKFFSDTCAGHQCTEGGSVSNEPGNSVFPTRAAYAVKELPMQALVEITAVAVTNESTR
uniref:Endoribonuclease L-PSP protein n=1 Tax=Neospora caninum (strain Liverpool) TaxID=572307 RepID=A0A0F7U8W0_NEOCL|nr:TPA: endoribonuclease L-PSP protein [Neospora caninum Liverpool]